MSTESILRSRALELAKPIHDDKAQGRIIDVVAFRLSGEHYGFDISYVREIHHLTHITPLPFTPEFVVGVTSLRGSIVSIVDIRVLLDIPRQGLGELNKVIVLHSSEMTFGIIADEISGTQQIDRDALQPAIPLVGKGRETYLLGFAAERLIILDAAALLSDKQLIVDR